MRSSLVIGFDGDDDEEARAGFEAFLARQQPPEHEVPVVVPVAAVLGRSDDAAVLLLGVRAHSTGLLLDVAVRMRAPDPTGERLMALVDGHGPLGSVPDGERLWFGVEFADGRRTRLGEPEEGADSPLEPHLVQRGGGGGGTSWDMALWLTPLPPPGDLLLVAMCRGLGVEETRTTVDGAALADAAARVEQLWEPVAPGGPDAWEPPPAPEPPPGTWFATMEG